MRIFILILTLIFSAAFVFLNILGFNGIITLNEFFLVNLIAEILACVLIGHFMVRTYVNHKKLKKLQQEMTTRQASATAKEQTAKKRSFKRASKEAATEAPATTATSTPSRAAAPVTRTAPAAPQAAPSQQPPQQPVPPQATQPMNVVRPPQPDADTTALYNTPFGK